MINKRLSNLSCNRWEYEKAKPFHETAINESRYETKKQKNKQNNRMRERNIIWFNPPYKENFKTLNIEKPFLKLIKKFFPWDYRSYKIFKRNTLKLTYSSMRNMSDIIKQHNCKALSTKNLHRLSNCRNKISCPLDGKCLQICMVLKVDVITNRNCDIHYVASDGELKTWYNNFTNLFCHWHHEQYTELPKSISKIQD